MLIKMFSLRVINMCDYLFDNELCVNNEKDKLCIKNNVPGINTELYLQPNCYKYCSAFNGICPKPCRTAYIN